MLVGKYLDYRNIQSEKHARREMSRKYEFFNNVGKYGWVRKWSAIMPFSELPGIVKICNQSFKGPQVFYESLWYLGTYSCTNHL